MSARYTIGILLCGLAFANTSGARPSNEDPLAVEGDYATGRYEAYKFKGAALFEALGSVARIEVKLPAEKGGEMLYFDAGTGFQISHCHVLTARHVVAMAIPPMPDVAPQVTATFALYGDEKQPTAGQTVEADIVSWGGHSASSRGVILDDWAILRVRNGQLSASNTSTLYEKSLTDLAKETEFAVAGFPADLVDPNAPQMWVDGHCQLKAVLPNRVISTTCLATNGNSGGPLFVKRNEDWEVAGILVRADRLSGRVADKPSQNFFIPIDAYLRRQIQTTLRKFPCEKP